MSEIEKAAEISAAADTREQGPIERALRQKVKHAEKMLESALSTVAALRQRVEELERERDDYRSKAIDRQLRLEESSNACAQLQADLDAALKWIEGYTDGPSGWGPTSQRVKALLEKRREENRG